MDYQAVKHLHMGCAALSGGFFLLRGVWMLRASPLLQMRWVRILPHCIDTLLLASALVLVFWSRQYPFVQPWLGAKVVALFVYIALGTIALKRRRAIAFGGALLTFSYIVAVAVTRQVLPFF